MSHREMPVEKGLDHTLQLLREGYDFMMNRKDKFHSRVFETRLLGEKVYGLVGKEEAELFYDEDKFVRKNAAPGRVQKTLFGKGGVQGLDGREHRHRKKMFMSLMSNDTLQEIRQLVRKEWNHLLAHTEKELHVREASQIVFTRVALRWCGIPFEEKKVSDWVDELNDLFEHVAHIGPKHWKARFSRNKAEKWLEELVEKVRGGKEAVDQNRLLYHFSMYKDAHGNFLSPNIAAVEILNLLRPTVAVSVYVDVMFLAMRDYPEEMKKIKSQGKEAGERFIQEVRRYYPFFPFLAARVKETFIWNGYEFEKGKLTLLDLYGTNHDPAIWKNPHLFDPDRFINWKETPFSFIPQGGGDFEIGHRCPGEWLTLELLRETLDIFIHDVPFTFPKQDGDIERNDIPPQPNMIINIV